jgi:hypothetical protein
LNVRFRARIHQADVHRPFSRLIVLCSFAIVSACAARGEERPASTSSNASYIAWDRCVVGFSADSVLRDLPPFPWKDPGPNRVMITGRSVRRAGPLDWHEGITLGNVLDVSAVSPETPVVTWRCEPDGRVHALRVHRDTPLEPHDWVVAPDPASVY